MENKHIKNKNKMLALTNMDLLHSVCLFQNKAS